MTISHDPRSFVQPQNPPAGTVIDPPAAVYARHWANDNTNKQQLKLFTPLTIRGLTLKNRIVAPPMCMYSCDDGFVTDWHLVHLGSLATRGVGLVIAEATGVLANGRISPNCAGLWRDEHIPSWKRIVDFAHSQNTAIGIQLAHAGRKASTYPPFLQGTQGQRNKVLPDDGGWENVWGPTNECWDETHVQPHEMTVDQIHEVTQAFVESAHRADKAGFDVVEIHGAHGYMISSFLSPIVNKRTDQYGGSFANRIRLLVEVVTAVRHVWPQDKPLFVRVSASDWVEGGWDGDQTVELARHLQPLGVDLLDCSSGGNSPQQAIKAGPLFQVPFSAQVKKALPNFLTGTVGIITTGHEAESVLQESGADIIMVGRALLRNPNWALDAANGFNVFVKWPQQYELARQRLPKL
ncbi:hypothetical protein H4R34_001056 [Dimargaris verticillata]|uniref:NADH:flavin oxidoreductase/NADH oxidase N-terminal domain-containing protein n=1 Tax=Dimargaris verticillata TaxID=2761393 RepID=A0A9W8B4B4_9FUNG|nr:hypothetical protein H4R34_001056 [Dimargaris verticillata]